MDSGSDCTQLTFRRMRGESAKIKLARIDTEPITVDQDEVESSSTLIVGEKDGKTRLSNHNLRAPVSIFGKHQVHSGGMVSSAETLV